MNEVAGLHMPAPTRVSPRRDAAAVSMLAWTCLQEDVASFQLLKLSNSANLSPHFGAEGLFCAGCFLFHLISVLTPGLWGAACQFLSHSQVLQFSGAV